MTQRPSKQHLSVDHIKQRLLARLPDVLSYLYPHGTVKGHAFYIGNVQGDKGDSLSITLTGPKQGIGYDFATGKGYDIISLWAERFGKDKQTQFREVILDIELWLGSASLSPIPAKQPVQRLGKPSAQWDYHDPQGAVIATVFRYDIPGDGKEYRPWDAKTKAFKAPIPRPLYNQPGILNAPTVILAEGEKAAAALINAGITATTAMNGSSAPLDKTDWSPLAGRHVIIWPDHDNPGRAYAERVVDALIKAGVHTVEILQIPDHQPQTWDAADAVVEGIDIQQFIDTTPKRRAYPQLNTPTDLACFSFGELCDDSSPIPDDLIAPRILTPGGLLVFGGPPKVGKSDLILHLVAHMAAGLPFLGLEPPRPLKVFYLQAEVQYHYLRERVQSIQLPQEMHLLLRTNLIITAQSRLVLNEAGVKTVIDTITARFTTHPPDIIVIDPLRNIFDGSTDGNENDNQAMLIFLKERIERIRYAVNSNAGVILVHHTRKLPKKQFEEDPFAAFSGAGSLRSYYTTGIILYKPDEGNSKRSLLFELRNGPSLPAMQIDKIDGVWQKTIRTLQTPSSTHSTKPITKTPSNTHQTIQRLLLEQARGGKLYTSNQFATTYQHKHGLGGERTIRHMLDELADAGTIKFIQNASAYGLPNPGKTKYGYLWVGSMQIALTEYTVDPTTGHVGPLLQPIHPTHYKCPRTANALPIPKAKEA